MRKLKILGAGSLALPLIAALPQADAAPVSAARSQYLADCAARQARSGMPSRQISSICAAGYRAVSATLPLAHSLIRLAQTPRSDVQTLSGLKAAEPSVDWKKQQPPLSGYEGAYARDLVILASGKGAGVDEISWNWSQQSASFPYDVPGALRSLGWTVAALACGAGGGNYGDENKTAYRVDMPGTEAFVVTIGGRDPAMGGEWGYWSIAIRPGMPVPSAAGLVASMQSDPDETGTAWSASCPE